MKSADQFVAIVCTTGGNEFSRRSVAWRDASYVLLSVAALLFAASAALTIYRFASMSAMGEMPMPGGWTLSTMWLRMCGQTWPGAAAEFLGMWIVMMVAMMLPALMPMLLRHRETIDETGKARVVWLTILVGAGYFFVWSIFGLAVFPLGAALAGVALQLPTLARAVPLLVGVVVLLAGAFQFTTWKAHQLACCRDAPARIRSLPASVDTAWRHGLHLGLRCTCCCANLTAILLVVGVMDLRVMAGVTAAITAERLAPAGAGVARITGVVAIGAGLFLLVRAVEAA